MSNLMEAMRRVEGHGKYFGVALTASSNYRKKSHSPKSLRTVN